MEVRPISHITPSLQRIGDKPLSGAENAIAKAAPAAAPLETSVAVPQTAEIPSLGQLDEAVKSINKTMQQLSKNIEFSVDSDSNRTIVKVVDQQTKEVIRQMPSEEALEISKALDRVQGLLLRHKV